MFGRLSQLAQNVQQSFNADESGSADQGSPSKKSQNFETLEQLTSQLEDSEERNKSINVAFKKLLKEKEEEIRALKEGLGSTTRQESEIKSTGGEQKDDALLRRKTEEYKMLIEQKDDSIQNLMSSLKEAEDLKDKIEEQERKNTEKLMFELAERIKAHETIQRKMEEIKHVMEEKDNAVHNMADQMAAQDELLKAREEAIKKLKRMAAGGEASEEMIVTLQKAVQSKDSKISEMAQVLDKLEVENKLLDAKIDNRDGLGNSKDQTIEALWAEIKQKNGIIQNFTTEKDDLLRELQKKDQELKVKLELINENEMAMNEANLKWQTIEKELAMKKSDIQATSKESGREMKHLKDQITEMNEVVKSKVQTIDLFQKEIEDKDAANNHLLQKLNDLQNKLLEEASKSEELKKACAQESNEKEIYKEKFETEANEKNLLKEQLDKVGSELSSELDSKASEIKELKKILASISKEKQDYEEENEQLYEKLRNCEQLGTEKSQKLEEYKSEVLELENQKEIADCDTIKISEKVETLKSDLMAKEKEIQEQRNRFDEELQMLKSDSENEKGNTANFLIDLENARRELEDNKEESVRLERSNEELKREIETTQKHAESQIVALEDENRTLNNTIQELKKIACDTEKWQDENEELKKQAVKFSEAENNAQKEIKSLDEQCSNLSQQVKELESAMNHVVEKLNTAELKINESLHENDELSDKLRQGLEEKATVDAQKTEMEIALEEFVKSTESRKRRSGRTSADDADGTRLIPNEGLSVYNTPVSRDESPRNSSYLEAYQPAQSVVSNAFEGKAIADIFKLVEEERCTLESKVATLLKDNNLLGVKISELEDYLELEKQKFRQVSEEISHIKQSFQEGEASYVKQLLTLQEENSSLREMQVSLDNERRNGEEMIKEHKASIEGLENDLKMLQDELADKSLEIIRLVEKTDNLEKEQQNQEEHVEKISKQNRQMKNKLKEFLKEKSEKEVAIAEKQSRIADLESINENLRVAISNLQPLESALKQKNGAISELEEEIHLKNVDIRNFQDEVSELKQRMISFEESRKTEIFEMNEKLIEVEQITKEQEEAIDTFKKDGSSKLKEIEDLNSVIGAGKEEIAKLKNYSSDKEEEIIKMKTLLTSGDENIVQLRQELEIARSMIQDFEISQGNLERNLSDATEQVSLLGGKNTTNSEIMSCLQTDLTNTYAQVTELKNEASRNAEEQAVTSQKLSEVESEAVDLRASLLSMEEKLVKQTDHFNTTIDGLSHDLSMKDKDIERGLTEKESLESNIRDLEDMVVGKDIGLKEILDSKNKELDVLKNETDQLRNELTNAKEHIFGLDKKLEEVQKILEDKTAEFNQKESTMRVTISNQEAVIVEKNELINELEITYCEKAKLHEISLKRLSGADDELAGEKEGKENLIKENDQLKIILESLADERREAKILNENLCCESEAREAEMRSLKAQLEDESDKMKSLTEMSTIEKEDYEVTINDMKQINEGLMSQLNEVNIALSAENQEKEVLKQEILTLTTQVNDLTSKLSEMEERLSTDLAHMEEKARNKESALNANINDLEQKLRDKELHVDSFAEMEATLQQKLNDQDEIFEKLCSEKEDLAKRLIEEESKCFELERDIEQSKAETQQEHANKNEKTKLLENETTILKEKQEEKNQEIEELLQNACLLKTNVDEKSSEIEKMKLDAINQDEKYTNLQKSVDAFRSDMEKCDEEFDKERDMFAAKISELNSEIQDLRSSLETYSADVEQLKNELSAKDKEILKMITDAESKRDELTSSNLEEQSVLTQALEEKRKAFEEYKIKATKKMKLMKEELKKVKANAHNVMVEEKHIAELEKQLESTESDKQALLASLENLKHKIIEMENLNESREENLRNYETEMSRFNRLIQDQNEEIYQVKATLSKAMEEKQSLLDTSTKRDEKVKMLQQQLIANEEDMMMSFNEKEEIIDNLKTKISNLEESINDKELKNSELSTSLLNHEEKNLDDRKNHDKEMIQLREDNLSLAEQIKEYNAEVDLLQQQFSEKCKELESMKSVDTSDVMFPYINQISTLQLELENKKKTAEEFKAKVAKKVKALKEEKNALNVTAEDLRSQLEKHQEESNASLTDVITSKDEEIEKCNIELRKLSQRMSEKEEELMVVKEMMQNSLQQVQSMQEDLETKSRLIEGLNHELARDGNILNESIKSFEEEASNLRCEIEIKEKDLKSVKNELAIEQSKVLDLQSIYDAKLLEFEDMRHEVGRRGQEKEAHNFAENAKCGVIGDGNAVSLESAEPKKEIESAEPKKEIEPVKLKLAKAIKRMGTMKKDLQLKDEMISKLEAELKEVKSSGQGFGRKEDLDDSEPTLSESEATFNERHASSVNGIFNHVELTNLLDEIKKKEETISSLKQEVDSLRSVEKEDSIQAVSQNAKFVEESLLKCSNEAPMLNELAVEVTVTEQSIQPLEASETKPEIETMSVNQEVKDLIHEKDRIQTQLDELLAKHSKTGETLEKAKKKVLLLKKVELKLGKENDELRSKLSEAMENNNKLTVKAAAWDTKMRSFESELLHSMQVKEKMQSKNADLKKLVEVMAEEKHDLDSEMKDMLIEIKDVMDIKNSLLKDLKDANDKLAETENNCQFLREALDVKEAQLSLDEKNLQDLNSLTRRVAELNEENLILKDALSREKIEIGEISMNLEAKDQTCIDLENSLRDMKVVIDEAETSKYDLSIKLTAAEECLADMPAKEHVHGLQKEVLDLQERNQSLMKINCEMEAAMTNQKDDLEKEKLAEKELTNGYEKLKADLVEMNALVTRLRQEIIEKDLQIEKMEDSYSESERKLRMMLDDALGAKTFVSEELCSLKQFVNENEKAFDIERKALNTTIEQLKESFNAEREKFMNEELELFEERIKKEQEIMTEKLKVETSELVKSFDDSVQSSEALEKQIQKLAAEKEHKDTVIAKLKLKLKQTIKDRDVIKNNSQSEIERLSQERDIIFNEFQAKIQQTESDFSNLKSKATHLEETKKDLEEALLVKSKGNDDLAEKLKDTNEQLCVAVKSQTESLEVENSLKERLVLLENEAEEHNDVIEKFEWEASEKEDQIRDLQKAVNSFKDNQDDWDEIKRTLEETIDVKEKVNSDLKNKFEGFKRTADENLISKNDKLKELENLNNEIKNQLKREEEEKSVMVIEVEDIKRTMADVLKHLGSDNADVVAAVEEFKEVNQQNMESRIAQMEELENEKMMIAEQKEIAQNNLHALQKEYDAVRELAICQTEAGNADIPLQTVLEEIISKRDQMIEDNDHLNDLLRSEKEINAALRNKYDELSAVLEKIKSMNYEEKLLEINEKMKEKEHNFIELNERNITLDADVIQLKDVLSQKDHDLVQLQMEKNNFELQVSELNTELDLSELELKQLKIDKENSERQLEILIQEADNFKSIKMPELQTVISTKNQTMLELRENFSEVISDKDSIITSLREKITDLQRNATDIYGKKQEENESFATLLKQKDEHIDKLTKNFANAKRNSDWLKNELSHVIKEKNAIGGSIQNEFESISKGLRGDIELFMEDKKNFENEFQIERLQLEKEIAEQQQQLKGLENKLNFKDKYLIELNMVVSDLKLRVESAADILSKESYYQQLEQKLEESYEKLTQANEMVNNLQGKLRNTDETMNELQVKLDLVIGEKDLLVLDYERKLQIDETINANICRDIRDELEAVIAEKNKEVILLKSDIEDSIKEFEMMQLRNREEFENELEQYQEKNKSLQMEISNLQNEKQELKTEIMNEVLLNADAKMLRMKKDFENVILHRDIVIKENALKNTELTENMSSLTNSNKNLSENLYALEKENIKLNIRSSDLDNSVLEMRSSHKEEIENILMSKGEDFKALRSQFDEALSDKEQILNNLRNRVNEMRQQMDKKCIENDNLNAQKDSFLQEAIRKDLSVERLKVKVDSLLNVVANLEVGELGVTVARAEQQIGDQKNPRVNYDDDNDDAVLRQKDKNIFELEHNIVKAKTHLENYVQDMKVIRESAKDNIDGKEETKEETKEEFNEENEKESREMREQISHLEAENIQLRDLNVKTLEKLKSYETDVGQAISNPQDDDVTKTDNSFDFPTSLTNMFGMPRAVTGFQILASETMNTKPDDKMLEPESTEKVTSVTPEVVEDQILPKLASQTLNSPDSQQMNELTEEIRNLKSLISAMEASENDAESKVRKEFDDILQNLREDLQSSLKENNILQAEVFMMKHLQRKEDEDGLKTNKSSRNDNNTQTDIHVTGSEVLEARSIRADGEKGNILTKDLDFVDASVQTDINKTQQSLQVIKNESLAENGRLKRYSSSERLPEVVEDTLCSKMEFENLQTYSDNSLDGEAFAGQPKLELRITDEQEGGDKSQSVCELQNEIESLKSKLDQSKRLIVKLKQMTKKYKSELSELQLEKFDQIRVYEDELNSIKQDCEEGNQERLRKDQEIRSLREEVRILVKEKSRTTSAMFQVKNDLQQKITALQEEVNSLLSERVDILSLSTKQKEALDGQTCEVEEKTALLEIQTEKITDLQSEIILLQNKVKELEECLFKENVDAATENPGFDNEAIEEYLEQIERKDIELGEAFELIRVLEKNQKHLEKQYETHSNELYGLIDLHEATIERMVQEKMGVEKSMQEMRNEVGITIEERDHIVNHWRSETSRITEENKQKQADFMQVNISVIEEHEAEIKSLQRMVNAQNEQIESLQKQLKINEDMTRELEQQNHQSELALENVRNELESALQNSHLAEDKLAFYEHQMENFKQENRDELYELRKELETADGIIKKLRNESETKENLVVSLQDQTQASKDEIEKHKKKTKKWKREFDLSKRGNQELVLSIKQEMENIVTEIQGEKTALYSELLAKESTLQEARICTDQLMKEKESWLLRSRTSEAIETDTLLQSSASKTRSPELDGLNLQIQQLKQEKDLIAMGLENRISELTHDYFNLQTGKRLADLQIAELKAKIEHLERAPENKPNRQEQLDSFKNEIQSIKGGFEILKNEAANFTTDSKQLLNNFETELTGFVMNAAKAQHHPEIQPLTVNTEAVELGSFLSDGKLEDPNGDLEEAKQQIAMLEESLYSWKDRCVDLEERLEIHELNKFPNRSGSQEFLINMEEDEGPSIETAKAGLGQNVHRLMKYSTSGMQLKTRARSFLSKIFGRQKGPIPRRKLLLMTYLLAIHVLAFMSVYWMLSS